MVNIHVFLYVCTYICNKGCMVIYECKGNFSLFLFSIRCLIARHFLLATVSFSFLSSSNLWSYCVFQIPSSNILTSLDNIVNAFKWFFINYYLFIYLFLTITVFIVAYLVHITLTCFTCCDVKPFQNKTEDWQNIINIGPIILYSLLNDVNVCAELWQLSQSLLVCQMPQSFRHLYGFSLDTLQ